MERYVTRKASLATFLTATIIAVFYSLTIFPVNATAKQLSPFFEAIRDGDLPTVRELLANDAGLISTADNRSKNSSLLPALHFAIRYGHTEIVEYLLSKGADPNGKNVNGMGALHVAASNGRAKLVRLLVEYGADINSEKNGFRHAPLCNASNKQVAEVLIANGADVNWQDERRATPLHSIAASGATEAAQVLLNHGADINAKDKAGCTPLHRAASRCRKEMIELLIAKGADINAKDRSTRGATPLNRVVMEEGTVPKADRKATAELLLSHGAAYTIYDVTWIGNVARVRRLLESDPTLANAGRDTHREPALYAAIRECHSTVLELLLANSAELNVKGRYKEPPLHAAAHAGHKEVVGLLLKYGVDVNQKGAHGEQALHWAVAKGHIDITGVLLDAGANVNIKTEKQRVDMDTLVEADTDVVKEWLRFIAATERQKQAGGQLQIMGPLRLAFAAEDTVLHSAVQWGHGEIVALLLAGGADVNAVNCWGQTPLHYATVFRRKEIVKELLACGADIDEKMSDGRTAADLASQVQDAELAELLRPKVIERNR